jgi:mono/diheme cytochrome c family protein
VTSRRFDLASKAIAAALLIVVGYKLWAGGGAAAPQHPHETTVAWRCDPKIAATCRVVSEIERCTTCHEAISHPSRAMLIDRHAALGCVACHGGDGLASEKAAAHDGLASRAPVPAVQARCAACHTETRAAASSPAKVAWAAWSAKHYGVPAPEAPPAVDTTEFAPSLANGRALFRDLRCGACHAASEISPSATPLAVLGLRGAPSEIALALRDHATRGHTDLGLDENAQVAVATHLAAIASPEESTAMVHRASVTGSSAEDGKTLWDRLACDACHGAKGEGRIAIDLGYVATARTADWVAHYLSDPARANPAAAMPNVGLTPREAASLAAHLVGKQNADARGASRTEMVTCKVPGGETKQLARDACGEAIVASEKCGACHADVIAPGGPSLARFGDGHDGASALAKLVDHAGFKLDADSRRDLATYLLAQRDVRVRPDLRVAARAGEESFRSRGCAGCHALDDVAKTTPGPSLFGEGLRTQPQWLFEYLRAPQRHPVRPAFHPELAYRDLVAPDHEQPRMPTYALGEEETTSLVRFFSERDGAAFPYAAVPSVQLAGDARSGALGDLERKDRGACTSCHTVATPDIVRARDEGPKLAPPLALAHERLRPAWIDACIAEPDVWVHGMPAFAKAEPEIERLRDLVLLLRERTVLPPAGQEGSVPALGLGDLP